MENEMTTDRKVARRKLSLLELASDLGNVSKACRMIGYSRQQSALNEVSAVSGSIRLSMSRTMSNRNLIARQSAFDDRLKAA
jgi:hypothetical protein